MLRQRIASTLLVFLVCSGSVTAYGAPVDPEYQAGLNLYKAGRYEEAIPKFFEVTVRTPNFAPAYVNGANCFYQLGRKQEAIRMYWFVVRNFPQAKETPSAYQFLRTADPNFAKNRLDPRAGELPELSNTSSGMALPAPSRPGPSAIVNKQVATPATARSAARLDQQLYEADGTPKEVVIPFQRNAHNHLTVSAAINGKPLWMMFDTGAEKCFINEWNLQDLGIKSESIGRDGVMLGVGGEVETSTMLVTLQVGTLQRQVPLVVQRTAQRPPSDHLPLLGQDFFRDYVFEIDDNKNVICLKKHIKKDDVSVSATANKRDPNAIPFRYEGSLIIVMAKINGRQADVILDSGAQSVAFTDKQFAALSLSRGADSQETVSSGVGGSRRGYAFNLNSLSLGPIQKKNISATVAVGSTFPYPLLGQAFLQGLKFTIDPKEMQIRFQP